MNSEERRQEAKKLMQDALSLALEKEPDMYDAQKKALHAGVSLFFQLLDDIHTIAEVAKAEFNCKYHDDHDVVKFK